MEKINIGKPVKEVKNIEEFKKALDAGYVNPDEGGFLFINTPELYEVLLNELGEGWQ